MSEAVWHPRSWLLPVTYLLCALGFSLPAGAGETRTLPFYNVNTKETVTITYKEDGEFLPEGMKQINHAMRDWRRDEPTEMDPDLIDLIWELYQELGSKEPIHLISAYRSRATNDKLRRSRGGQARNSRHILGKAADIHFPDVSAKTLRNSALVREIGGVGYYPKSSIPFVHVDTGRIRHWPRLPRQELAALFPKGKTAHRPRDNKPITLADARRALKSGKYPGPPSVMIAAAEEPTAKPADTRPAIITAGLGGPSLSSLAQRAADITGAIARPVAPKPDSEPQQAKLALASASAMPDQISGLLNKLEQATRLPKLREETIASSPDIDDPEHPEKLSYEPFSVVPFIRDVPVSHDLKMAALSLPEFQDTDYLLIQPDRGLELHMAEQTGVTRIAASWEFQRTGGAKPAGRQSGHPPSATEEAQTAQKPPEGLDGLVAGSGGAIDPRAGRV